jgi:hypothetical protein
MSDSEVPSGAPDATPGGPIAGPPTVAAPGLTPRADGPDTVPFAPPTQFRAPDDSNDEGSADLFAVRYSRHGSTPVPYLIAAAVAMAAAWWAFDWSKVTPGATDPVRSSEWWTNVTAVLLPGEQIRFASYSAMRMWVALALLVLAALTVAVWIGRIGSNLRTSQRPFGSILPIVAFPAWWLLPVTIGMTDGSNRSRADLLLRYLVAFGMLLIQFVLVRWPTLNRIWRAGYLRYDLASVLLWLPMMVPWSMLFLSTSYTALVVENARSSPSGWYPTVAMVDWARDLTRATGLGVLALLVVVTVAQHIGIRRDRAIDRTRKRPDADVFHG